MKPVRNDRALMALLIGFGVLAGLVLGTVWLSQRQDRAAYLVQHTLTVENRLSEVLSHLQDAEAGQRGYLLTGRSVFLIPYDQALGSLGREVDEIERITADNPAQQARAKRLRAAIERREQLLRNNLDRYRRGESALDFAADMERGRASMDEVRRVVADMKAEETRLLRAATSSGLF